MKFLQELVRFNRLTDREAYPEDEEDDLLGAADGGDPELEMPRDEFDDQDMDVVDDMATDGVEDMSFDDMEDQDLEGEMGDGEPTEPEDPDRQGLIRTVNKAHMLYKRKMDDGTYDEMWMYNVSNLRDNMSVRKAILAGTDIPPSRSQSPDGSQSYELWTAGNAEMMLIKGLPQ